MVSKYMVGECWFQVQNIRYNVLNNLSFITVSGLFMGANPNDERRRLAGTSFI